MRCQHLLRALENERVFTQLERSKREHAVLRRASQALGAALTEQAVLEAALTAAAEIAPYDFAAVTQYDPDTRVHCVRKAIGEGADGRAQPQLPRQHLADRDGGEEPPLPAVSRRVRSAVARSCTRARRT